MAGRRWIRGLAMMAMVASVCVAATARAAVDEETPRRFHFALDGHAGGVVGLADKGDWRGGAAGGASIRLLWDLADGMTSLGLRVGTLFTKLPYGSCDGEPFFGTSSICGKAGTPTFTTLMSVAFVAEIRVASFASVEVVGGLHFEPVPRTWPFPGVVFGAAAVFDLYQGETATLFARVGADVYLVQVAALFPQAGIGLVF